MKLKKAGALLLTVLLLALTMHSIVFADTPVYRYTGGGTNGTSVTLKSGTNISTKLFEVKEYKNKNYVGDPIYAYCIDFDTSINNSSNYNVGVLENAGYFSNENAKYVRAIIYNSYPYITLDQLKAAVTGVSDLSIKQAIAGTQLAIWHYTNGAVPVSSTNDNILKVYNYLLGLDGMDLERLAKIEASGPTVNDLGDKWEIVFSYNISDSVNNNDQTPVTFSHSHNGPAAIEESISETGKRRTVTLRVSKDAIEEPLDFVITITGNQTETEAWIFAPKIRKDSQTLVSVGFTASGEITETLNITTPEPTAEPTQEPTAEPTQEPTAEPTQEPTPSPTTIDLDDDDIPGGDSDLPKTGELPPILFYGAGSLLTLGGYLLRRKYKMAK